jgi:hypothetical protein
MSPTDFQSSPKDLEPYASSYMVFRVVGTFHCGIIEITVVVSILSSYLKWLHIFLLDVAKVLVGVQVPSATTADFDIFLDTLGYHYTEETNNPVFKRFL